MVYQSYFRFSPLSNTKNRWVDRDLVERLFSIADVNKDDIVDFHELVSLLSRMFMYTK